MVLLPQAEKEQSAAFICDKRVLVVVRFTSPLQVTSRTISFASSGETVHPTVLSLCALVCSVPLSKKASPEVSYKHTWFGHKIPISVQDEEKAIKAAPCPTMLFVPAYKLQWPGLAVVFMGNTAKIVSQEWRLDRNYTHFALLALVPFLLSVSLFFTLQLFQNVSMAIGPIAQYFRNSHYYSVIPPQPNREIDAALPHITIQMPVYKESLDNVLHLSFKSLKKAMQTYARQGRTSSIFVNNDGL